MKVSWHLDFVYPGIQEMDRSSLNKATSADDTPTPGYLYTEILGLTRSVSVQPAENTAPESPEFVEPTSVSRPGALVVLL